VPTLNDHIPLLLTELANAMRSGSGETIAQALLDGSPPAHGLQRVKDAFDIEEVVAEYNILRGCIHDLADRNGLSMHGRPFHVLNRVLDGAIGSAVRSFATQKALEVQHRREEYLTFVAHDLRTPLGAISLSARVLELLLARDRSETPEITQKFKTLNRNVRHLQDLIEKVLQENANLETEIGVKLERRRFDLWPLVEGLIHDLHPVAGTDSTRLVNAIPDDFVVYADAGLLRRVFQNLIANAISYTPRGEVVIGANMTSEDSTAECFVRDNGEGIPEDTKRTPEGRAGWALVSPSSRLSWKPTTAWWPWRANSVSGRYSGSRFPDNKVSIRSVTDSRCVERNCPARLLLLHPVPQDSRGNVSPVIRPYCSGSLVGAIVGSHVVKSNGSFHDVGSKFDSDPNFRSATRADLGRTEVAMPGQHAKST
jgi:two-component system phosphate regulon sensor histidine kinase PhoR